MSRLKQTYQLVKALTRGEKRFFNLYANKYSKKGENNILQLFSIFDSISHWDKNTISSQIKKKDLHKFTSVINNKLLDNIITSLRLQGNDNNIDLSINKFYEEAKVLFQREIFDLALDRIKKAKKIAYSAEKNEKLLDILNLEKFISVRAIDNKSFIKFSKKIYQEKQQIIKLINNKEAYWQISDEMFFLYRKNGRPSKKKEIDSFKYVLENPLLKNIDLALSTSAKSSFYFIYTIYYLAVQELDNALDVINEHLKIINTNFEYLNANLDQYVAVLNNALYIHSERNDTKSLFQTINLIRELPKIHAIKSNYFDRRIFETTYSMELDHYIKNLMINEAISILPTIKNELDKYGKAGWSLDRFLSMAFGICLVFYYQNDINKTHEWIDNILNYENKKSNIQIIAYTKIVDLILHYKLKNYNLLQYRIKSVKRFLVLNKRLHPLDDAFFKLLNQLSSNKIKSKSIKSFLATYSSSHNSYTKSFYQNYLRIEQLCRSIEYNESFNILLKQLKY